MLSYNLHYFCVFTQVVHHSILLPWRDTALLTHKLRLVEGYRRTVGDKSIHMDTNGGQLGDFLQQLFT